VPAKFRAGKSSRTTVGGAIMSSTEYSAKDSAADLDTSNFESNGFHTHLIGLRGCSWTLTANWDAGQNAFSQDPPGLFPRDDGGVTNGAITLYTNLADNKFYQFPLWCCFDSDIKSTVTGLVTFNSSGASNGPYSIPSGNV
jgi:hypothetical protein